MLTLNLKVASTYSSADRSGPLSSRCRPCRPSQGKSSTFPPPPTPTTNNIFSFKANAAHINLARAHGAQILEKTKVGAVIPVPGSGDRPRTFRIVTQDKGVFTCDRVILSTASWVNLLLNGNTPLPLHSFFFFLLDDKNK